MLLSLENMECHCYKQSFARWYVMLFIVVSHPSICRSDVEFQEFCLQVLFECISKDRPALLQVYLSLYTTIGSMTNQITNGTFIIGDSLALSSLKLALSYNEALLSGRLTTPRGSIVQSVFLGSLRKRVEELLHCSEGLKIDFCNYLNFGRWPNDQTEGEKNSVLLSWYLQWFAVPSSSIIKTAMEKVKPKIVSASSVPLLRLLLPRTHINAIGEIDKLLVSPQVSG